MNVVAEFAQYKPRLSSFIEVAQIDDWTVKVHGLSASGEPPSAQLIEAAKAIARRELKAAKARGEGHCYAILTVHSGGTGDFVLVDWWFEQDLLRHKVFGCPKGKTDELRDLAADGGMYCVWELRIAEFERAAWVKHVLGKADNPDFEAYLKEKLEDWV